MRCVRFFAIAKGLLFASLCLTGSAMAEGPFKAPATPSSYFQDPAPAAAAPAPAVTGPETAGQQVYGDFVSFCNSCAGCGWYGGAEGTFLAPFSEPSQTVILTDLITGEQFTGNSDPGFGAGIRTWVGIQRCGWGTRATYWHFGNDNVVATPITPNYANPAYTQFNENYHLNMDVLDLEFTQQLCCYDWMFNSSIGGRYADVERSSTVVGIGRLGNGVELLGLATGSNEMEGAGLTFSLGAARPLYCNCNWQFFWNYRGSLLWTSQSAAALTQADVQRIGSLAGTSRDFAYASTDTCDPVYVSEVQIGFTYTRQLCCVPAKFFCKIAAEYQHWDTGDSIAQSGSFAQLTGTPGPFGARVDAFSNAHDGDLDLIGFTLGAGFTY